MRRSNVVKTWTSKQRMMALAISCGLLGLVLKLSGTPGSRESTAPAAPHGPSGAARDASDPTGSQVEIGAIREIAGSGGTMSFWLQPGWEAGNQDDATLLQLGDSRVGVVKNGDYLRFEVADDGGITSGIGAPITDWKQGEW